jgi:hypothetical protein
MTTRATRLQLRKPIIGLVALASCAALAAGSTAAPARHAATRSVKLTFVDSGVATQSNLSDTEKSSTAVKYRWTTAVSFSVPAKRSYSVLGKTTLVGTWTGDYRGTRFEGQPYPGDFHCSYAGTNVHRPVTAQLVASTGKTVQVVFYNSAGFFPVKGAGVKTECSNEVGTDGPPHFSPSWLFRDSVSDHYRMTADTAIIELPRSILSGGSATVKFPNEVGSTTVTLKGKVSWHNVGRLVAKNA